MEVSKRQVHLPSGAKRGRAENGMAALCAFSADVFTQQNNREQALFGICRKTDTYSTQGDMKAQVGETSVHVHEHAHTQEPPACVNYFNHLNRPHSLTLQ